MRRRSPLAVLKNRFVITVLAIALLLIAVRIALPFVVEHYANRTLNEMPGYEGHIEEVDIHLWRGAYAIHGVELVKLEKSRTGGEIQRIPVLSAETVDLSVEWGALMHGTLVGQIEIYRPAVNILAGPAKKEEARDVDDLIRRIRELTPLNINRFAIVDGELHFRNYRSKPDVDIYLDDVNLVARNLTNSARVSDTLVATVSGEGRAMRSGRFNVEMKVDPFEKRPTYDLAFELKDLRLPELNSYLRHYLAVVARDGTFSLYTESSAKEGRFVGYAKPIVKDLDILHLKQEDKSVGEAIKGFFLKIVASVFENKAQEQLATRVEFSGKFENPEVSVWDAVVTFLRNAFVQALRPGLEGSVAPEQAGAGRGADPQSQKEQQKTRREREALEDKR